MMRQPLEPILDELLVLRCQAGDTAAFDTLARRWHPRLLRYAMSLSSADAESAADIAQDAWTAIVRGLGRLSDPARFPAWALRIVANKSRDGLRKTIRRRHLDERYAREPAPDSAPAPDTTNPDAERHSRLRAALRQMPDERRALLSMAYLDALPLRRIAEILEIPEGTVKSRLFHARNQLRTVLEGDREGDSRTVRSTGG